jgi:hypothetical protein
MGYLHSARNHRLNSQVVRRLKHINNPAENHHVVWISWSYWQLTGTLYSAETLNKTETATRRQKTLAVNDSRCIKSARKKWGECENGQAM